MRRKRLICAIMALVLLLSSVPPALAVEQSTTVITATAMMPEIYVEVPGNGAGTLVNPLSLPVDIDGSESTAQVISYPSYIANYSEVAMKVDVTVYGSVNAGSTMSLASSTTKGTGSTAKAAFLYFEMVKADSDDPDDAGWAKSYSSSKHIAIANKQTLTKSGYVTLSKASGGNVAEGGYAQYRVTGDAVSKPSTAWDGSKDGVTVLVAFTFTPQPYS